MDAEDKQLGPFLQSTNTASLESGFELLYLLAHSPFEWIGTEHLLLQSTLPGARDADTKNRGQSPPQGHVDIQIC